MTLHVSTVVDLMFQVCCWQGAKACASTTL
jgi:hypothetical protein